MLSNKTDTELMALEAKMQRAQKTSGNYGIGSNDPGMIAASARNELARRGYTYTRGAYGRKVWAKVKLVAVADMVPEAAHAAKAWEKIRKSAKGAPTASESQYLSKLMNDINAYGYYRTMDGWVDRA